MKIKDFKLSIEALGLHVEVAPKGTRNDLVSDGMIHLAPFKIRNGATTVRHALDMTLHRLRAYGIVVSYSLLITDKNEEQFAAFACERTVGQRSKKSVPQEDRPAPGMRWRWTWKTQAGEVKGTDVEDLFGKAFNTGSTLELDFVHVP